MQKGGLIAPFFIASQTCYNQQNTKGKTMKIETVKVKDKAGNQVIVNKEDAHLYAEFNKPKAKNKAKKAID